MKALAAIGTLLLGLAAAQASASDAASAADGGGEDLAKKVANPVSSLVSLPFQNNWQFEAGPENDTRYLLNVQPVIPARLTARFNLISRVIVPLVSQVPLVAGGEGSFGLGDASASFFLTPAAPHHVIWAVGPVLQLPLTSDPTLGSGKWGAGPTALVLVEGKKVTYGMLASQVWSFAGDGDRAAVNAGFFQPFVTLREPVGNFGLSAEAGANWDAESGERWTVPVLLTYTRVTHIGHRPTSFAMGPGYYAEKPTNGPAWLLRFNVTFLFPGG